MARRCLPSKISIGPYTFEVIETDMAWYKAQGMYGQMREDQLTIEVCIGTHPASVVLDTFLHEILHAVYFVYFAYNLDDADQEERVVTCMSTGLTQVIITNPCVAATIISLSRRARKEAAL